MGCTHLWDGRVGWGGELNLCGLRGYGAWLWVLAVDAGFGFDSNRRLSALGIGPWEDGSSLIFERAFRVQIGYMWREVVGGMCVCCVFIGRESVVLVVGDWMILRGF